MGTRNLWKFLKDYKSVDKLLLKDKRLAVDASIWIKQIEHVQHKSNLSPNNISKIFLNRIIKLLYNGIDAIFVFDGNSINNLKGDCLKEREKAKILKEEKELYDNLINNKICDICNKFYRECVHGVDIKINEEVLEELRENESEVKKKYDWGEVDEEDIFDEDIAEELYDNINKAHNDLYNLSNLQSINDKVSKLNELRSNRKISMHYDDTTDDAFIMSQLANVKKRNSLMELVKDIQKHRGRIESDSSKRIKYKEENVLERKKEEKKKFTSIEETKRNKPSNPLDFSAYDSFIKKYNEEEQEEIKPDNVPKNISIAHKLPSEEVKEYLRKKYNSEYKTEEHINDNVLDKNITIQTDNPIVNTLMYLLNLFNIRYILSTGESDTQCIGMFRDSVIDGTITEDNDILVGGCTTYRNVFKRNLLIEEYQLKNILQCLGINHDKLILMSVLMGSDYYDGVKNIGFNKSLIIVKNNKVEEITERYNISSIFRKIKHIYTNGEYIKIEKYVNGKIDKGEIEKYMKEKEMEGIEETMKMIDDIESNKL